MVHRRLKTDWYEIDEMEIVVTNCAVGQWGPPARRGNGYRFCTVFLMHHDNLKASKTCGFPVDMRQEKHTYDATNRDDATR